MNNGMGGVENIPHIDSDKGDVEHTPNSLTTATRTRNCSKENGKGYVGNIPRTLKTAREMLDVCQLTTARDASKILSFVYDGKRGFAIVAKR